MMDKIKHILNSVPITTGLLLATGLLSFLLFLGSNKREEVLFYPLDDMITMEAELRVIPHYNMPQKQMEQLVREILLHPVDVRLNPIVPEDVTLRSLMYDKENQTLYIDLSDAIVITDRSGKKYPSDTLMLEMLEKNIRFHYPMLEQVLITVNGMVPFRTLYR